MPLCAKLLNTVKYTSNKKSTSQPSLHLLFNALMPYPRMPVNLLPMTIKRINAISTMRRGLKVTAFDIDTLTDKSDCKLFRHVTNPGHTVCTTFSLLKHPPTVLTRFVRGNIHTCFPSFNIHSLKTLILIIVYLNMCNFLTITSCFSLSAYCRFHTLCVIYFVFYMSRIFVLHCLTV